MKLVALDTCRLIRGSPVPGYGPPPGFAHPAAPALRRILCRRSAWPAPAGAALQLPAGSARASSARACARPSSSRGPRGHVTASGNLVPVSEHVLASPIDTRLTRRLKAVGDSVRAGEPVVELDTSEARLALVRLEENIALTAQRVRQQRKLLTKRRRFAICRAAWRSRPSSCAAWSWCATAASNSSRAAASPEILWTSRS